MSLSLRKFIAECGGACGDLGTFIPHVVGAIAVAGLAPFGVLAGFGAFMIGSGVFYDIPMAVQPMKAVSAVILTTGLTPGEIAAAGLMLGSVLLILGASGLIGRVARVIPQSVSVGLQVGLGALMGVLGWKLMLQTPFFGASAVLLLLILSRIPHCPAAPLTLAAGILAGYFSGTVNFPDHFSLALATPRVVVPSPSEIGRSLQVAVIPQLALTLTNAVIVTASVARELFPNRIRAASERNLSLTSGIANLLLAPWGAMPMCHGAGGVQAQYRFGARTGIAPVMLGSLLLLLAVAFSGTAIQLLTMIPTGTVGALLMLAGIDLAKSRRLFDAKPSCWPVIATTALVTMLANPAFGLVGGWFVELVRATIVRRRVLRRQPTILGS